MSLQAFQQALVDFTLAPGRARRLIHGDRSPLEAYDLTEREADRLLSVIKQPGMSLNCTIARGNRFNSIGEVFPMTCVLLEPVLRELLDELWEGFRPSSYQFAGEEQAFADMVRQRIAKGELRAEYVDEVFAYECACWELAQQLRSQSHGDKEIDAVVEFKHAPDLLLPPLSEMVAPPPGLPTGVYRVRIVLRGTQFDVEMIP
jgi:hypothetical protein